MMSVVLLALAVVATVLVSLAISSVVETYQAKKEMVAIGEMLQKSDLDWTLVRFVAPQNKGSAGRVKVGFGDTKMKFSISREDIGAFMIKMLDSDQYIHSMPIIGS